jgi:hypothetical protein
MTPIAAIFGGTCVYLIGWFYHDHARVGAGAWRPPRPILRLLRFGNGPVFPSAVAFQVWGLSMALAGVLAQTGVLDPTLESRLLAATIFGINAVGVVWVGLFLAHWLGRKR